MTIRTKNFIILMTILILGGLAAALATYFFDVSPENLQAACTEEAMECPDGSAVGRTGPNCEFEECPIVPSYPQEDYDKDKEDFQFRLQEAVRIEVGQPIEGYEPQMFMAVFPGLKPHDFDGVEAQIGVYRYDYEKDELVHDLGEMDLIHSAAPAISEEGMNTLFANVTYRMGFDIPHYASVEEVVSKLKGEKPDKSGEVDSFEDCVAAGNPVMESYPRQCRHKGEHFVEVIGEPVACTMDAKMCPDGSTVGRTGPNCEFEECLVSELPIRYGENMSNMEEYRSDCERRMGVFNECGSACGPEAEVCIDVCSMICEGPAEAHQPHVPQDSTFCTHESKEVEACIEIYQPVCGLTEVQCIKAPCYPVPQTFSNSCFACSAGNVSSYTEGTCEGEYNPLQ